MGQKVSPIGIRLGVIRWWSSTWYAEKDDYAEKLLSDLRAREFLLKKFPDAGIGSIQIERPARNAKIRIRTARPGTILGPKGKEIERLRETLTQMMGVPVHVTLEEIRRPELDAKLVANSIAQQLERRVMFRRAMKKAVTSALRAGAKGIKVAVAGRLGGTEIARTEWYREGRVPLHTLRADIDYALGEAKTTYGIIGVKVWIFKGEVLEQAVPSEPAISEERDAV